MWQRCSSAIGEFSGRFAHAFGVFGKTILDTALDGLPGRDIGARMMDHAPENDSVLRNEQIGLELSIISPGAAQGGREIGGGEKFPCARIESQGLGVARNNVVSFRLSTKLMD